MKKLLQAVASVALAPVVLAFARAFFSRVGRALTHTHAHWWGIDSGFTWLVVGAVVFGLGHVLLARTSLEGVFKPGFAEWFWRKTIRWRPSRYDETPPSSEEERIPQPPAFLRMIPYCLPVILIVAVAAINVISWATGKRVPGGVMGLACGFLLAEHLVWVGRDMKERNPNMSGFGFALTVVIVLWVNMEVIAGLTALTLDNFSFVDFNKEGVRLSVSFYDSIWISVRRMWR